MHENYSCSGVDQNCLPSLHVSSFAIHQILFPERPSLLMSWKVLRLWSTASSSLFSIFNALFNANHQY
jgi:hypothetical protein